MLLQLLKIIVKIILIKTVYNKDYAIITFPQNNEGRDLLEKYLEYLVFFGSMTLKSIAIYSLK